LQASPAARQKPRVGFQVVLQQILVLVGGQNLEIIGSRPLGMRARFVPSIQDFQDLESLLLASKPARRLVSLESCVTFDLDGMQDHRSRIEPACFVGKLQAKEASERRKKSAYFPIPVFEECRSGGTAHHWRSR